jgi:hypothetical protein
VLLLHRYCINGTVWGKVPDNVFVPCAPGRRPHASARQTSCVSVGIATHSITQTGPATSGIGCANTATKLVRFSANKMMRCCAMHATQWCTLTSGCLTDTSGFLSRTCLALRWDPVASAPPPHFSVGMSRIALHVGFARSGSGDALWCTCFMFKKFLPQKWVGLWTTCREFRKLLEKG